jgi:cytochrome c-type biogenesis protein CcmH/NrfF
MTRPLLATLFALALVPSSLAAQRPPATGEPLQVHPEAKAAIDRIRSPYCPGMMLEVCTSSGGAMLRDSIQRMAESGLKADSIVEIIIGEYGEEWRAEPPLRSSSGLLAWVLPPLALVLGLGTVGVVLARRRRLVRPEEQEPPPEVSEDDERRLKDALKVLDEEEEPVF